MRLWNLATFALLAASASAQSFNLDVGQNQSAPLPSLAYGAAANQPGQWVSCPTSGGAPVILSDINNLPTGVTIQPVGGFGDFFINNPSWVGDDANLMEDASDVGNASQGGPGGLITWTVTNLAAGKYSIYTYALAPDFPATFSTIIDVPGAPEGAQTLTGSWAGSPHVLGISYAKHSLTVQPGQNVTILTSRPATTSTNFGTVNGFQLVKETLGTPLCFGDGSLPTACPCGNFGATGNGCDNSIATGGSNLTAVGSTSADTVVLTATGELPTALSIFLQGTTSLATPLVFGDGVRCAGGALKRLYVRNASGGVASAPQPGNPSITTQSTALGDPIAPLSGATRIYQVYYRDPNLVFCANPPGNSWNISSAVSIIW